MTFGDLEYEFQISRKTIPKIIKETCIAIWSVLQPQEMPAPTKEFWLQIAEDFQKITQYPNCIGSVDGKHIRIICPPNSGSEYFNFKRFFSIVLMAVSDANYYFTAIDVGSYGREGDSSIFKKSNLGARLKNNDLDFPPSKPLPVPNNCTKGPNMPYVLLGDEAFGLSKHMMRPYPTKGLTHEKRVYNYRHCRGRRVVECAFGILSNKWRVLHSAMLIHPEFVSIVVQACCILHNFVRRRDGYLFEDTLTCTLAEIDEVSVVGGLSKGIDVRESFCQYFNGPGALPWQNKRL